MKKHLREVSELECSVLLVRLVLHVGMTIFASKPATRIAAEAGRDC